MTANDHANTQAETAAGAQHVREALIAEADACRERMEAAEAERDRWKDMAELRRRRQLEAEAERDEAHTDRDEYITIAERLQAERDLAVRQRDHAQDALRQIADKHFAEGLAQEMQGIARAALGDKPPAADPDLVRHWNPS